MCYRYIAPLTLLLFLSACTGAGGNSGSGQGGANVNVCNSANTNGDCNQSGTNANVGQTQVAGGDAPGGPGAPELPSLEQWLAQPHYPVASRRAWVAVGPDGAARVISEDEGVSSFDDSQLYPAELAP